MNALWDHYWPAIVAALVIGVIAGAIAFRRPVRRTRSNAALVAGIAVALGMGALWHGPVGTGERFAAAIERQARQVLVDYEMTKIQARIQRSPLKRILVLSGQADDFQRIELARIMELVPGVASARWIDRKTSLPLLAEVELACLAGFGLGLALAYLLELRRRSRAQWRW